MNAVDQKKFVAYKVVFLMDYWKGTVNVPLYSVHTQLLCYFDFRLAWISWISIELFLKFEFTPSTIINKVFLYDYSISYWGKVSPFIHKDVLPTSLFKNQKGVCRVFEAEAFILSFTMNKLYMLQTRSRR